MKAIPLHSTLYVGTCSPTVVLCRRCWRVRSFFQQRMASARRRTCTFLAVASLRTRLARPGPALFTRSRCSWALPHEPREHSSTIFLQYAHMCFACHHLMVVLCGPRLFSQLLKTKCCIPVLLCRGFLAMHWYDWACRLILKRACCGLGEISKGM